MMGAIYSKQKYLSIFTEEFISYIPLLRDVADTMIVNNNASLVNPFNRPVLSHHISTF